VRGCGSRFEYGWMFILLARLGFAQYDDSTSAEGELPKPHVLRTSSNHLEIKGQSLESFAPVDPTSILGGLSRPRRSCSFMRHAAPIPNLNKQPFNIVLHIFLNVALTGRPRRA